MNDCVVVEGVAGKGVVVYVESVCWEVGNGVGSGVGVVWWVGGVGAIREDDDAGWRGGCGDGVGGKCEEGGSGVGGEVNPGVCGEEDGLGVKGDAPRACSCG